LILGEDELLLLLGTLEAGLVGVAGLDGHAVAGLLDVLIHPLGDGDVVAAEIGALLLAGHLNTPLSEIILEHQHLEFAS
jgi:hypothetical protein